MVYEVERDGRPVYCNSLAAGAVLLVMGWRPNDPNQMSRHQRALAADLPHDNSPLRAGPR
jgi:hypothetical protein